MLRIKATCVLEYRQGNIFNEENVFWKPQCTICTQQGARATLDHCCEELLHCY